MRLRLQPARPLGAGRREGTTRTKAAQTKTIDQNTAPPASAPGPAPELLGDRELVTELSRMRRELANVRSGTDKHTELAARHSALNDEYKKRVSSARA
jgi:hypothetical protein